MSAWIVSREHINLLVAALMDEGIVQGISPDEIGSALWRENLRSVAYRYPNDGDGERPGPVDFRDGMVDTFTFRGPVDTSNKALVLKQAHCYDYQSCEHPEYGESIPYVWIRRLCDKLVRSGADRNGVAYDKAPWGL